MAIPKKIILTGKVYLEGLEQEKIDSAELGDLMLYIDDKRIRGNYEDLKMSSRIKAQIFDGLDWQFIDITEFCKDEEHKFSKRQKPIYSAQLCQDILQKEAGVTLNRVYRGHYTIKEHIPNEYIRKKSQRLKK